MSEKELHHVQSLALVGMLAVRTWLHRARIESKFFRLLCPRLPVGPGKELCRWSGWEGILHSWNKLNSWTSSNHWGAVHSPSGKRGRRLKFFPFLNICWFLLQWQLVASFAFTGWIPAVIAGAAPLAQIQAGTCEQAAYVEVLHSSGYK